MASIKRITSFTHHTTAEGSRISATYSEITEEGVLQRSNERFDLIVTTPELQEAVDVINSFLAARIPE